MACDNLQHTIVFSKTNPVLNETIVCTATVHNTGTTTESFHIAFSEQGGAPFYTSASQSIAPGSTKTVTTNFQATVIGTISLCADLICDTATPGVAPVAAFTASPTSGESPLGVQFTNQSTGTDPMTYQWNMGEESTLPDLQLKDPHWTFWDDVSTSFTISLTVTNAYGSNTVTKPNYITLGTVVTPQPPVADFSASPTTGTPPLTVQFTDQSTGTPTTWQWYFKNDGVVGSTSQNPSYTYTSSGTYSVKMTATNAQGSNSVTKSGIIVVSTTGTAPVAAFTASPTSGTQPVSVQFTNTSTGSPTSFAWTFGDGGTSSAQNPTHTYTSAGAYAVALTVTNAYGSNTVTKASFINVTSGGTVDPSYGAGTSYNGSPIGGGAGYADIKTTGSVTVSTRSALASALASATAGQIVFITGTATIDVTGTSPLTIPAGVTVASNRGYNGSDGALLIKSSGNGYKDPIFIAGGNNVRLTGLRMEGEMFPSTDSPVVSENLYMTGIWSKDHSGLEVDNCEIRGFAWADVYVDNQNSLGTANAAHIHHNYIHYSLARSEGYGIQNDGGVSVIEANIFDNNRHSIAAGGLSGESYTARYNIHLGHGTGIGFCHFDIHGSDGNTYYFNHNTFESSTEWCIGFQSSGHKSAIITKNVFNTTYGCTEPVFQVGGSAGMNVSDNYCNGTLVAGDSIVGYF